MGYFPSLRPGGGSGFTAITTARAEMPRSNFSNTTLLSMTIPADAQFAVLNGRSALGSGVSSSNRGIMVVHGLIDLLTDDITVTYCGARNRSPQEPATTSTINLVGNTPFTLFNITDASMRISTYGGPGGSLVIQGSQTQVTTNSVTSYVNVIFFQKS